MHEELEKLAEEARQKIARTSSTAELNQVRIDLFGKKGSITQLSRRLKEFSPEERPLFGKLVNDLRQELTGILEEREEAISRQEEEARLQEERIDVELPGRRPRRGRPHPLLMLIDEITGIFLGMGFDLAEGPEIEWDYYNFEALNIPRSTRPGRCMIPFISPRKSSCGPIPLGADPDDGKTPPGTGPHHRPRPGLPPGHAGCHPFAVLFQIEGLAVDEGITFGDLKGVLTVFVQEIFGKDRVVRFRPSFFPFTEPSAEVDVSCGCQGAGCRICKGTGWLEIMGAGSVDPWVLGDVRL